MPLERWAEELLEILWAHWFTLGFPTQETPFWPVYGMDVMVPV